MKIIYEQIPVNFNLSFLKIRWSNHVLIKDSRKVVGEGVVYGGDWKKAEKLARQMAKMKFGRKRGDLKVCEQIFIGNKLQATSDKKEIQEIISRGSNLKVKVGRNIFEDIKTLEWIRKSLNFPNSIRIDANRGYSIRQLEYLIPTLVEAGVRYVEEPVKRDKLIKAAKLLRRAGMKIILDETLQTEQDFDWVIKHNVIDGVNIKLSRVGDINQAIKLIKLSKKLGLKVVVGCAEELERGMGAIFALGHEAKKQRVLLEVEGFGPLRLNQSRNRALVWEGSDPSQIPVGGFWRFLNRVENAALILKHQLSQILFDCWWEASRTAVLAVKKTKLLSSLSLRLVKLTGKHSERVHPKHLISRKHLPVYLDYIGEKDVVLDIGCGNGQHSILVAGKARQVIGFDVSRSDLKIAAGSAEKEGIQNIIWRRISAEEPLDFKSDTFDRVLLMGVLEHLGNRDQLLREVWRVLKNEGQLLLGIPNEKTHWKTLQRRFGIQYFTDPDHKVEYSRKSITKILKNLRFKIAEVRPTAYDTPWAGLIDLMGGFSLSVYESLIKWKWALAKKHPEESISYFIVAGKKV